MPACVGKDHLLMEDAEEITTNDAWQSAIRVQALERLARRPPQAPRVLRIVALAILLALHAAVFLIWYATRYRVSATDDAVVQVRLLEAPAALPLPVPPPPHVRATRPVMTPVLPPATTATVIEPTAPLEPTSPQLFNRDGSIHLPVETAATPLQAGLARGRELLARGHNIIHCKRSRFDNSLTPAEAAAAAASSAHMAHLIMGNPLDVLNDVGQGQAEDAAGEHAARKRRIEELACDG